MSLVTSTFCQRELPSFKLANACSRSEAIPPEWAEAEQISQANERSERLELQMKEWQEQNQKTQEEMLNTLKDYEEFSNNDDQYIAILQSHDTYMVFCIMSQYRSSVIFLYLVVTFLWFF